MGVKKSLLVSLMVFVALLTSVFANPIQITGLDVSKEDSSHMVLVDLFNANNATGINDDLTFSIKSCGTSHVLEDVRIEDSKTLTKSLKEVISTTCYESLKDGVTYQLEVTTSQDSMNKSFLFGSVRDTEGLDLVIDDIKINNREVTNDNTLRYNNGEQLDIDIEFTTDSDAQEYNDARFRVEIQGYEHDVISGSTQIFTAIPGISDKKTMSVNLPSDMESGKEYKLRIYGANDLSGLTYKDFNLYVGTQRHRVDIVDLIMTPSSGVEAGQNVIGNVRLKNRGEKDQESVKVNIAIPELGVSESSYLSLETDTVQTSDDMLMLIPENAKAGQYEAEVTLNYNDGYTSTVEKFNLNVLSSKTVEEKNLLVSYNQNVDLKAGEETSFDIVIANPNQESKPISLMALDNTWSDVQVSPSLAMIDGGDDAKYTVKVTPKDAIEGEKTLNLVAKDGSKTTSEISVNTYVESEKQGQINWVNVALAVLLIIAIIILLSLVITIAKRKNDNNDNDNDDISSTEEYY